MLSRRLGRRLGDQARHDVGQFGATILLEEVPGALDRRVGPRPRSRYVLLQHLGPAARPRVTVGERREEGTVEAGEELEGVPIGPRTRAAGREAHEQRQLARPRAEGLVGERRVVRRQNVVGDFGHGGPLHEKARPEGRELLGEPLVVEQHLGHGDGAISGGVDRPGQASGQCGVRGVEGGVRGHDPSRQPWALGDHPQPKRAAPVLDNERQVAQARGVGELGEPAHVTLDRMRRAGHRLV